jgi:mono/diheme cytochrome c family protein
MNRNTLLGLAGIPLLLAAIQAIPYGRERANPPVVREPRWAGDGTRALAKRACFDCHSNETAWPGYARVAPVSWLVRHDVDEGRRELNFSDWTDGSREGERPEEIRKAIEEGEMPPLAYRLLHPEARLTREERGRLAAGLVATATGMAIMPGQGGR